MTSSQDPSRAGVRPLGTDELARLLKRADSLRSQADRLYGGLDEEPTRDDLEVLQRLFDDGHVQGDDPDQVAALAVLFGQVVARVLDLEWVQTEDESGEDAALRYAGSTVVFYPRRMIQSQVEHGDGLDLDWLLSSTADYLKNLLRFVPSQIRS